MAILLLLSLTAVCVWTDLSDRKIYNNVLLPVLAAAFLLHGLQAGLSGFGYSFLGLFTGLGLLIIPYLLGGMGAGDVKLLGVIGALMGPAFVFDAFLYTALTGGLIALVIVSIRGRLFRAGWNGDRWLKAFPYGVPIAIGTLLALMTGGGTG
ncbi:prepilin peptidase [Bacillus daqingensis]|uniref:Prepilin peptidase n=1 Tax=Bacillus daqingensis TaxID=872396 RepID=A0ABV9NXV1_9BACI